MRRFLPALAVAVLLLSPVLRAQSAWTVTRSNLPGVNQAYSIAFGNGRFVATFGSTTTATPTPVAWSLDGLTWRASSLPGPPPQGSVIFVAGAFYLAGGNGVWRSPDGDAWQQIYTATAANTSLRRIATDGRGLLVGRATSNATTLLYSPDLVTWRETAPLPGAGPDTFHAALACANGHYYVSYFVTAPGGALSTVTASTSGAGTEWIPRPALASAIYLAGGNGRLLAITNPGGALFSTTSIDNLSFFTTPISPLLTNGGYLGCTGGRFFLLGSLNASFDGASWSPLATSSLGSLTQMVGIAYGNGRYVAVGNAGGTSTGDVVAALAANAPPVITADPTWRAVPYGSSTTFSVTFDNPGMATTFQWRRNGNPIAGATSATYTIDWVTSADEGLYTVTLRNALGTVTSAEAGLNLATAPGIVNAPTSLTSAAGASSVFTVLANGTPPFTYQWFRNGVPLPGATASSFTLATTQVADAGSYSVAVTNVAGTVTAPAATLGVIPVSRISNLSVLTALAAPGDSFELGYVVSGLNGQVSKPLLVRAVGPSLASLGVGGVLDDPKLRLLAGTAVQGENDNWAGLPSLAETFVAVGAFPYAAPSSKDAALAPRIVTRDNTVTISAANTTATGLVLAEIYDASPNGSFDPTTPRLINVSVLKPLGDGLTVGFTLTGSDAKTVLVRAVGPTLGQPPFGVSGFVADPQLALFRAGASTPLATNDNWGGTADLAATFTSVGAFALPAASRDAVLRLRLQPGGYSVQVTGVNHTTGTALVEIYEVP